ncbi:ribosomal protein S18-alanine N-acetyltransferase [Clostridium sp. E02]|uniref:ribosomal protein S18-alanine N-acetyltransferase n=1 Tax=Clostridium sp. E02 TaxID=2487134 RepID=UPI000F532CFB|nr:ribosomal protein S18-alanine N-acetyltransferase [Clostridium sp. E02]
MVREMEAEDVLTITGIEQVCFPDPWSYESIMESLNNNLDTWFVVEMKAEIVGYCVFRIIAGEGELLRIALLPKWRGRGLSKKLMDQVVFYSRRWEVSSMFLEVRSSNECAVNLYRSYGFLENGIRKNYYQNPCEDAILMTIPVI